MIIVAMGIMLDADAGRPYYSNPVNERPGRKMALQSVRLRRSRAIIHREAYRRIFHHRRSIRRPISPYTTSPLRTA